MVDDSHLHQRVEVGKSIVIDKLFEIRHVFLDFIKGLRWRVDGLAGAFVNESFPGSGGKPCIVVFYCAVHLNYIV